SLLSCTALCGAGAFVLVDSLPSGRAASPAPVSSLLSRPQVSAPARRASHAPLCTAGNTVRLDGKAVAYAVTVRARATAYRLPGGRSIARFGRLNVNGVPTVLGV